MTPKQTFELLKQLTDASMSMSSWIHESGGNSKRGIKIALNYQEKFLEIYRVLKKEKLEGYHKQLFDNAVSNYDYFVRSLKDMG